MLLCMRENVTLQSGVTFQAQNTDFRVDLLLQKGGGGVAYFHPTGHSNFSSSKNPRTF